MFTDLPQLTIDQLQAHLDTREFLDGVELTIEPTPWEGPFLRIFRRVPNSYRPGEDTVLDIHTPVPPMRLPEQFDEWIVWRLSRVETHEVREWFRDRTTGRPVFDPHAEGANLPSRGK